MIVLTFGDRKPVPLQNRVDPFGAIHADPARGLFTGNRGVIHDPAAKTLLARRWTTRAWLVCACDFRGRRRAVMGRNAPSGRAGWTELFFLDEPTALAAGHRPCFFCRREAAKAFLAAFASASGTADARAADLDARLHRERLAAGATPVRIEGSALAALPDGAVVASGRSAWAKRGARFLPWSFGGYGPGAAPGGLPSTLSVLTPAATLSAIEAGYAPIWHPTADQAQPNSACAIDGTSGSA